MARERVGAKWDAMRAHMYSVQIQRTLVTIDGGGDEGGEGGDEGGEGRDEVWMKVEVEGEGGDRVDRVSAV